MNTQSHLSLQDLEIITTISESEKATVNLVSIRGTQEMAILKCYPKEKDMGCYRRIAELQSQYFSQLIGIWQEKDKTFLLEEYISGCTLQEKLEENAKLRQEEVTDLGKQICQALQVLHTATPPIIHRDIKPENIMITGEGKVRIIDFDAAREYNPHKEHDTVLLGTKEYASPEQFGYTQTDMRSDIYSWGIVFAEVLEHANVNKDYALRAQKIIDKATMFDPNKRYEDTTQLLQELNRLEKNKKLPVTGVLVTGALLLGVIATLLWKGNFPDTEVLNADTETQQVIDMLEHAETPAGEDRTVAEREELQNTTETQESMSQQEEQSTETIPDSQEDTQQNTPASFAEAYQYTSIEQELLQKRQIIMDTRGDLYSGIAFEDNDAGMYSATQETAMGNAYVALRFLKGYPRDIVICDTLFEGLTIDSVYYYPYIEEQGINGSKVLMQEADYSLQFGNVFSVSSEYLQTLSPGAYTFFVDAKNEERDITMGFYLVVHGEEEDVTNFRIHIVNEISYFSSQSQNDVVFYVNSTPYPIHEIRMGDEIVSTTDYELVDGGFGIVFHPDFLSRYEDKESLEMVVTMENGKQARIRIIYLKHF